jgi:hypothetical protein
MTDTGEWAFVLDIRLTDWLKIRAGRWVQVVAVNDDVTYSRGLVDLESLRISTGILQLQSRLPFQLPGAGSP